MNRSIVAVLGLVALTTGVVAGQNRRAVTTADYDRAVKMLAPSLNNLVVGDTVNATWLPDGRFWYARTTLTGSENVVIDPVKKTREVVQTPPEGGQASPDAGGRGGRGGGGGRGGRGGGCGRRPRRPRRGRRPAPVAHVRAERDRHERPAAAVDVARREEGDLH